MSGAEPPPLRQLPPQLEVVALVDQEIERKGFYPTHPYIEAVYTPVLGCTAVMLYRRIGTLAALEPDGLTVDTIDLSLAFGLGDSIAKNSKLSRSVGRLCAYNIAEWQEEALAVRRALPPVSPRTLGRLTRSCRDAHEQILRERR